ncbi:MAG: PLP-dependent aminotransferase family protein, partial [Solirubrobacteraceae bacterium]
MSESGTSAVGPELLVELDRTAGRPLRAQLEDGLRAAIRSGWVVTGGPMPSTRAMARDLGVSRRLVVDAYAQLVADGYLATRPGAGTFVADVRASVVAAPGSDRPGASVAVVAEPAVPPDPIGASWPRRPAGPDAVGGPAFGWGGAGAPVVDPTGVPARPRFDLFPGHPDLAAFPRAAWTRALRDVLRTLPDHRLGYPHPAGAAELRTALAGYLARVRGVVAAPDRIVVTCGAVQGLVLLARALAADGPVEVVVEDPSLPEHRQALVHAGVRVRPVPIDREGVRVDALGPAAAALVTPAHQMPTGVALSQERRAALLAWAGDGGLVIEDDYDAEFRYDRAPLAALQGLAPEQVVHVGSV